MRTLFQIIQQEFQKENDLVLASIVASSGSTPRGAGSRMLVGKKGRVAGTIGGGSVEYRAELMALDILEKKESCEHEFRLNRKDVENIGMICGGDVTVFFQYLDHNDPIIMELAVTAETLYKERKDFWLICDLHATSGMSLYSASYGLTGNADVPSYLPYLQDHAVIAVKPATCLQNKSVHPELSMYLEAGMFHKSWYQYLQVLTFTASFWMTVRNLQILLFSRMQRRQSFAILIIWIRAFLSQMLIIAVS
mgnify:CR=1 FL=1